MFSRRMLILFTAILIYLSTSQAYCQIEPGTYKLHANGFDGDLVICSMASNKIEATMFGDQAKGSFNQATGELTLFRYINGSPSQCFTGYAFLHQQPTGYDISHKQAPTALTIAGTFTSSERPGTTSTYGWYAVREPVSGPAPGLKPTRSIPVVLTPASPNRPPFPLEVGRRMPFMIVDFTSANEPFEGCPGVMISNQHAQGIVIWAKHLDSQSIALANAIGKSQANHKNFQCYLVGLEDTKDKAAQLVGKSSYFLAGAPFREGNMVLERAGIDQKYSCVVSLIDGPRVVKIWTLLPGELNITLTRKILSEIHQLEASTAAE